MTQYIDKSALVAEIENMLNSKERTSHCDEESFNSGRWKALTSIKDFLDTLEVKEIQKKKLYVVTRCEEHSDYVEKVFFSEKEAEEYCKQFEGNEDAYGRDITEIEVNCPAEVKEVDLEEKANQLSQKYFPDEENIWARPNIEAHKCKSACIEMAEWLKAQKGE